MPGSRSTWNAYYAAEVRPPFTSDHGSVIQHFEGLTAALVILRGGLL